MDNLKALGGEKYEQLKHELEKPEYQIAARRRLEGAKTEAEKLLWHGYGEGDYMLKKRVKVTMNKVWPHANA